MNVLKSDYMKDIAIIDSEKAIVFYKIHLKQF